MQLRKAQQMHIIQVHAYMRCVTVTHDASSCIASNIQHTNYAKQIKQIMQIMWFMQIEQIIKLCNVQIVIPPRSVFASAEVPAN